MQGSKIPANYTMANEVSLYLVDYNATFQMWTSAMVLMVQVRAKTMEPA